MKQCGKNEDNLTDCNGIRTHNHLVHNQTVKHWAKLASLAKWLNVRLWTTWLWVRIPLQLLKLKLPRLFRAGVPWHSGNYRARSSCWRYSVKKDVLKNFANFIGKHLCWSLFLIEVQAKGPATLLKTDSNFPVKFANL